MTADCQVNSSPSSGWMFRGPPLWRASAFLGFWVRAAPHDTPRIGAVVHQLARRNRVAGSGEIAGPSRPGR